MLPYVLERAAHIGFAFIGGFSIDAPTMAAARAVASRREPGRVPVPEDPVKELKTQIAKMEKSDVVLGINLRGTSRTRFRSLPGPWEISGLRD